MSEKQRPTSPHLQIYKWNISSLTSIMHRLTGVLLYFSILAISWVIVYYAYKLGANDPVVEAVVKEQCDCPMQKIMRVAFYGAFFAIVFAVFYHFLNGIRHLFWDIGKGFELKTAKRTGYIVMSLAIIITIAVAVIFSCCHLQLIQ